MHDFFYKTSQKMILLADSGSTTTKWVLFNPESGSKEFCDTGGINPYFQSSEEISQLLKSELNISSSLLTSIHFYGAGCTGLNAKTKILNILSDHFNLLPAQISVESDLMAAVHSLCGNSEGICAILGTGSNSCYYDGKNIIANVPPLGYILGDEGSGAYLGRHLIADILKKQLPDNICRAFFETSGLNQDEILTKVYRHAFPNRFLASFTGFLYDNQKNKAVYNLIFNAFVSFFHRNICQYPQHTKMPVHFTGSVAWYFSDILKDAAKSKACTIGKIEKEPMEGLISYYMRV